MDTKTHPQRMKLLKMTRWMNELQIRLNKCKNMEYNLYLEISCGNRWHYHGDIKILNPAEFYIFDVPRLRDIGSFEIDTISNQDKWDEYCMKQWDILEKFMDKSNVEINLTNNTKLDVFMLKDEIHKIMNQKVENIFDNIYNLSDSD